MAHIYINEKDREILYKIKSKEKDEEIIECLERLLIKNNESRKHHNANARIYKKKKRLQNKNFARSKKEINKRKKINKESD